MSDTNRQDDWQAGVLGELTGTGPSAATPPTGDGRWTETAPPAAPVPPQTGHPAQADAFPASGGPAPGQAYEAPGGAVADRGPGQGPRPGAPAPGQGPRPGEAFPASAGRPYPAPGGPVPQAGPGQGPRPGEAYPAPGQGPRPGEAFPASAGRPYPAPGGPVPQAGPGQGPRPGEAYPAPGQAYAPSAAGAGPWEEAAAPVPGPRHQQPQPQPRPSRRAAPETVPVLGAGAPLGRPRHGDPLMRRTLRTLRGALGSSAAKAVAAETGLAAQVQQPVTTGRHIVVTSIRGGSGKTTVTALLSRTYNHFRHDPVLTLEADAALGTLPVRLGVESLRWTCGDLAQIVRPSMQLTDITGYLVPLPDGGWLLPGSQGRIGAQVDVATYRTVMVALRRYFGVTVVDCETLPGEVARTALDTAHARVLTTPATAEGLVSTHAVLDWLASLPVPVLPRTVVVLTVQSPHPAVDLAKATERLAATGAGVVVLPYDRHLASGGAVRTDLLGEGTRQAAVRLAAEVLQRAVALPAAGGAR
ncbi:MinD-like ATPase involved in chromosome partitioning or flagellar assembly [Streptomyces sp. 3211.6]|uniref:hypothetical protein n=1 Tax=Streptomyces sp. 3211.6 TaxID=1938845 RepID=UPI000EAD3015|nr:hypothetical protein [Streptomyces sp. 3211.6]RKT05352.1 MinD-like ATPase involved in chromosome partitioning or flagellar assembly [Streptomyces sp. 3211.6]